MSSRNSKKTKKSSSKKENKKSWALPLVLGITLIVISLFISLKTFTPVIKSELNYRFSSKSNQEITPINTDFSIVIPKINANTKVIANIDPFNSSSYQQALTKGVAHSSTSDTPDKSGNVFIFAHSAGNWYQANQYNAVFYLLTKLEPNDQIYIYYQNKKYTYSVNKIETVNPEKSDYLNKDFGHNQLTLMTCWPPGTTLKRLIVIASLQSVD